MAAIDARALLEMSSEELDDLFRSSEPGAIPRGEGYGNVLVAPGTDLGDAAAKVIHATSWKGKVFDPDAGELRNEFPFGLKLVKAKVYVDESWLDDRPAIILDYSKTSLVAHWIRDEIRTVAPGVYLGIVYWSKSRLIHFSLTFKV